MPFPPARLLPRARTLQLLALLALAVASSARAAHETDVADAMDEAHPLEVDLDVGFTHQRRETRITRENLQTDAQGVRDIVLVDELKHFETIDQLDFRLGVGLYHDLELHIIAPFALRDAQDWNYGEVGGVSVESASTLKNNHLDISGCAASASACDPNGAASPILPGHGQSLRAGFRDPTIGIAWGPINEERELRLKPELFPPGNPVSTWVLGFDYTLPLPGDPDDPSRFGAASAVVAGGPAPTARPLFRKAHVFSLWTAFSKRFKVLDPYVSVRVNLPLANKSAGVGDGAYDNCWHPELLSDVAAQNCPAAAWKGNTGYQPPTSATFTLGTELVAAEDPVHHQKFALDLRGSASWFSPGRTYTQVTDALGKLTMSDEYLALGGSLGIYGRAARWLHVRVAANLGVETAHFITSEAIGKDLDGDGRILVSAGSPTRSPEQSPTYDFRLDQIGRRLRAEATFIWGVSGFLSLNF